MFRLLLAAGLLLVAVAPTPGASAPLPKVIQITLHPAAPPTPVLKYPLLPDLRQQKPGNAAPLYRQCVKKFKETIQALDEPRWGLAVESWMEKPPSEFPREQARAFFAKLDPVLKEVADAARHEYADWELTDKLRERGISVLLSDMQETRDFASLLVARARLAQLDGRLDDALRDLQTVFAMSRHLGHSPSLISFLIGNAHAARALQQLTELLEHPQTPNLYWALTDLPQPFLDMRMPLQGERLMAYGTFPGLVVGSPHDPHFRLMTEKDAEPTLRMMRGFEFDRGLDLPEPVFKIKLGLEIQRKHKAAQRALRDAGWAPDLVAKMPLLQVALLHGFLDYDREMDEIVKWQNFPYWQAAPALNVIESRVRALRRQPVRPEDPACTIVLTFLPNIGRLLFSRTRVERQFASLRVLEALRLYAAAHDGQLPAKLDDIKEVPIPLDPLTGKPFEYTRDGVKARLYAPPMAPPNRPATAQDALWYEITMKK